MKKLITVLFCLWLTTLAVCPNVMAQLCSVSVAQDTVLRSRWSPTVALITMRGIDTVWIRGGYEIEYIATESRDLFWLPGTFPFLNQRTQTINQLIILLPSWWTSVGFDGLVEIMEVVVCNTVTECCDSDEVLITMLPFFLDQ